VPGHIRDLSIGIGWDIDDRALRKANRTTDEYLDSVRRGQRDINGLSSEIGNLDSDIRGISDPVISAKQPVRELGDAERAAEGVDSQIRGISDPSIDTSQTQRELQDAKEEALDLKDVLGGIGGAVGGSAAADTITSWSQVPREIEAQLGVAKEVAKGLSSEVEDVFVNTGVDITTATGSVTAMNRYFNATGDVAGNMAERVALLSQQTGSDINDLSMMAKQMDDRFADIHSPQEAFNMMAGASEQLSPQMFDELMDQFGEFSTNVASSGMEGQDFFAGMVKAGQEGQYVMDRFGDTMSSELIQNVKEGSDSTLEALNVIADSEDQLKNWQNAFAEGGEEGKNAINQVLSGFSELEGVQQNQVGTELFGDMYTEQSDALNELYSDMSNGMDKVEGDVGDFRVRHEGAWNGIKQDIREGQTMLGEFGDALGGAGEVVGGLAPTIGAFLGAGGLSKGWSLLRGKKSSYTSADEATTRTARNAKSGTKGIAKGIGKGALKVGGRALLPVGLAMDSYEIATAKPGDERRNAIGSAVGGWSGAAAGAAGGATLGSIIPGVGTAIGGTVGGIAGYFGGSELGEWVSDIDFSALPEKAKEAKDEAMDWLSDLPGEAANELGKMAGRVATEMVEFPSEFGDWFEQAKNNATDWLKDLPEEIGGFISEIPANIERGIDDVKSAASKIGSSVIEGISSGIDSAKEAVGGATNWAVDKAVSGVDMVKSAASDLTSDFTSGFSKTFQMPGHATGGIFDKPHVASFAEGGYRESVIPIDRHRDRALDIWNKTGEMLGVNRTASESNEYNYNQQSRNSQSFSVRIDEITIGGDPKDDAAMERNFKRVAEETFEEVFASLSRRMPRVTEG